MKINNTFSKIALDILEDRYYLKDENGQKIENKPEDVFKRVSSFISQAEDNYKTGNRKKYEKQFYDIMMAQELMPATPILFNAGTDFPMMSSCFALPIGDSLKSILTTLYDSAIIFKHGGGVGWNFSNLREKDAVLSTGGSSSGVCSFISLYDYMIEIVKQGGKRKGAGAAILDISHPDVEEFIDTKTNSEDWTNINISVICTDAFMNKVFEGDERSVYLFNKVADANWQCGDPNIIFIDTINKHNTIPKYPIDQVNPCHEIVIPAYGSCNLTGINLNKCVKGKKGNEKVNWDKLGKLVKTGHRFLDNMIDLCYYPHPKIDKMAKNTRRQGLYFFGLAPMLIKLGLRYGSQESLDFADNLFCYINRVSLESCINLGKERGNFPDFDDSVFKNKYKSMRCSNRLTIAPSGTTSRIADSYFSIEPYYAFEYTSNILGKQVEEKFAIKDEYGEIFKEAVVMAHELSPEEHLRMMATINRWIDQSISKTVNVPYEITPEEINSIFKLSYKMGLKCISVFRDGCKTSQVLVKDKFVPNIKKKGNRIIIDKNYLKYLYVEKGYSRRQISEILGISLSVVSMRLKEYNIPSRSSSGTPKYVFKPEIDTIKFLNEKGLSRKEIAKIFDRNVAFVNDIIATSEEHIGKKISMSIPLTPLTIELIEGELLGNGEIQSLNGNTAYYYHISDHLEYLEWLDELFSSEGLVREGSIEKTENSTYIYKTISCIELHDLYEKWYVDNKKVVPKTLKLTPIIVRQWFLSSGSTKKHKKSTSLLFNTNGYNNNCLNNVVKMFKDIGIDNVSVTKNSELYIRQNYTDTLLEYMESAYYDSPPVANKPLECKSGVCKI